MIIKHSTGNIRLVSCFMPLVSSILVLVITAAAAAAVVAASSSCLALV